MACIKHMGAGSSSGKQEVLLREDCVATLLTMCADGHREQEASVASRRRCYARAALRPS